MNKMTVLSAVLLATATSRKSPCAANAGARDLFAMFAHPRIPTRIIASRPGFSPGCSGSC